MSSPITEQDFNQLAEQGYNASRWLSKLLPTSTRRCRCISSLPTSPIPTCWSRCRAANASGAIPSSACPPTHASACAANPSPLPTRAEKPRTMRTIRWTSSRLPSALQGRAAAWPAAFYRGLAGYFGYDTVRYIEPRLAATQKPDVIGTRTSC